MAARTMQVPLTTEWKVGIILPGQNRSETGNELFKSDSRSESDKSTGIRLYGICVLAPKCHPPLYSSYAKILCQMYADHANPPKVLRAYLSSQTDGQVSYQGDEFSADEFDADLFRQAKYDVLLARAAQHIPTVWQALVTGQDSGCLHPRHPHPAVVRNPDPVVRPAGHQEPTSACHRELHHPERGRGRDQVSNLVLNGRRSPQQQI
jgi:hypothetical protein